MLVSTLYLDTSVVGGYFDEEWAVATQELWRQKEAGKFHFVSSTVTLDELAGAPERVRNLFQKTFPEEAILDVTAESEGLASAYLAGRVVTAKYTDDARHVAVCTTAQLEYLVSWNFRHLVNVEREKGFNGVNLLRGYRTIRIVNPLSSFMETKTKSFDAVAESTKWREATSRKLDALSLEERLVYLQQVRERYSAGRRGDVPITPGDLPLRD